MDKIIINNIDEEIYHEQLDNGLSIFIYKKVGYLKKGAYFVTNYGSAVNDFKPIGEDKTKSFPKGIAHFLEHKLFESSDNEKVFDKFKKYGADVNAYTNHTVTNYYFSTVSNFNECLIELLDFVQSPHFTKENVEKEKGIIYQEINMTSDDVDRFIFEEMFNLSLINNGNKYRTIGDKLNVSKITKEDLYKCYNTFYNPSNMALVIYGDIDINETIEIVRKNQSSKHFEKIDKIQIEKKDEPEKVEKSYEVYYRKVSSPKIGMCYKIKFNDKDVISKFKETIFVNMFLELKFGGTSSFEKELLKNKIIENDISYNYTIFDDIILIFIEVDTYNKDKFIKEIDDYIKNEEFSDEMFDLSRKAYVTSMVKAYENPSAVGTIIFNQFFKYKRLLNEAYDVYNNYTYDEFIEKFRNTNFNNKSVIYVTNKEE